MNNFVNKLKELIPAVDIIPFSSSQIVTEHDVSATLKKIELEDIDGYDVSNNICKLSNGIFAKTKHSFLTKDCDGITLFQYEGVNYLLFTELKTTMSFSNADKAYNQVLGSMLKTLLIMRMLTNFYSLNFKFIALLVGRKHSTEDMRIQQLRANGSSSPKCKHILKLLVTKIAIIPGLGSSKNLSKQLEACLFILSQSFII